jgi:hypothetical protein
MSFYGFPRLRYFETQCDFGDETKPDLVRFVTQFFIWPMIDLDVFNPV